MFMCGYICIGLLIAISGFILYLNVDYLFDRTMSPDEMSQAKTMIAIMVANLAVSFPFGVYGGIIATYERFVFQRVFSIARIIISTIVLIAVLSMGYKALGLVIVQTAFNLITLLTNYLYTKIKLGVHISFHGFDFALLWEILIFSWWNFLGTITDRIYWNAGQFVLGAVSGMVSVAIYSVAIALMNMYMTMSCALNSVLLPKITKMAVTDGNDNAISDLFIRTGRLQFCVLALILSVFVIFGKSFIVLWAGSDYSQSYQITIMFFMVLLCPLIQNVGITILQARGQQKFRSLSYLFIAILCLMFQIFLGRKYGAAGCGWAVTGALFLGQWIVMNIYYQRKQKLNILAFWRQIARMAAMPIVITMLGAVIIQQIDVQSWKNLIIAILIYSAIYIPLFWRFSMNKYEKMQFTPILRLIKV